jgi:hypothetical protein
MATRIEWYLGPDEEIQPSALDTYEGSGLWIAQPKMDGMWAMLEVHNPANGLPHFLKSRDANTSAVDGSNNGGFPTLTLPAGIPEGTILVGELEAASEWAKEQVEARGYRKIYLFDMPRWGNEDLRDLPLEVRLNRLASAYVILANDPGTKDRFSLVSTHVANFKRLYDAWVALGGEGLVLKRKGTTYRTNRSDGKTEEQVRCKRMITEDYVLVGIGKTPKGQPAGLWGLYSDGKLVEIFQKGCPVGLLKPEYVGKIVCEFKGWKRFKSGALQHAQFLRVRRDKSPDMCVFKNENGGVAA